MAGGSLQATDILLSSPVNSIRFFSEKSHEVTVFFAWLQLVKEKLTSCQN